MIVDVCTVICIVCTVCFISFVCFSLLSETSLELSSICVLILWSIVDIFIFQFLQLPPKLFWVEEFEFRWHLVVEMEVALKGGPVRFLFRLSMVDFRDGSVWHVNEIMDCLSFSLADLFVDKQDTTVD